jgi:hypothetical protein
MGDNPENHQLRVLIRIRPDTDNKEGKTRTNTPINTPILDVGDDTTLKVVSSGKEKIFSFSKCFPCSAVQEDVYLNVSSLVTNAVHGYHSAIFAYGGLGSGKSHTIIGVKSDQGIMPRAIRDLFAEVDRIQNLDPSIMYHIEVSYIEIYNNKIRNLLRSSGDTDRIDIHESRNLGVFLSGSPNIRHVVKTVEETIVLLSCGNRVRATRMSGGRLSSR